MPYLTANGLAVTEGTLTLPAVGRAIAELRLSSAAADEAISLGDTVKLEFDDGTTYQMGCIRAGEERGLWRVRLAAGKGKLSTALKPKFYDKPPAALPLRDIITEAGEAAGTLALSGSLPFWVRTGGPAFEAIRAFFIAFPGHAWRVMPDGKVWAGKLAWAPGPDARVIERHPTTGRYVLEHLPGLQPAVTLDEIGDVDRVVQVVGRQLRTEVYTRGS